MNKASERQARYDAKATTQVKMKLHLENDRDVLEWLAKQPSKQGAIKDLIREAIKKES